MGIALSFLVLMVDTSLIESDRCRCCKGCRCCKAGGFASSDDNVCCDGVVNSKIVFRPILDCVYFVKVDSEGVLVRLDASNVAVEETFGIVFGCCESNEMVSGGGNGGDDIGVDMLDSLVGCVGVIICCWLGLVRLEVIFWSLGCGRSLMEFIT